MWDEICDRGNTNYNNNKRYCVDVLTAEDQLALNYSINSFFNFTQFSRTFINLRKNIGDDTHAHKKNCTHSQNTHTHTHSHSHNLSGYLYAIQHGARVIYDTEGDIELLTKTTTTITTNTFPGFLPVSSNIDTYTHNNEQVSAIVNPLFMFTKDQHIWPRG